MRKSAVAQCRVWQLCHHCDFYGRHDFSTFDSENSCAQNLVTLCVHNSLHETASFVDFKSPRHTHHRQLGDANVAALSARVLLGKANTAQLRIDKNRIRHLSVLGGGGVLFDELGG